MPAELKPGLRHSLDLRVDERLTVPAVSAAFTGLADMPQVFATAFLVGFIEWACIEAIRPYLAADEGSVGIHVDLSHVAATPVGMRVTADVELVEIAGRRLTFKVTCRDEAGLIGEGRHQRAVIKVASFKERVAAKAEAHRHV